MEVEPVRQSSFVRNVTFALVLLLLVGTIHAVSTSFSPGVQQYIHFVLTHDLDVRALLETVRLDIDWPLLRWVGLVDGSADEADDVTDEAGR